MGKQREGGEGASKQVSKDRGSVPSDLRSYGTKGGKQQQQQKANSNNNNRSKGAAATQARNAFGSSEASGF